MKQANSLNLILMALVLFATITIFSHPCRTDYACATGYCNRDVQRHWKCKASPQKNVRKKSDDRVEKNNTL